MNYRRRLEQKARAYKNRVYAKEANINIEQTYNLDHTMIEYMLPRLKVFKKVIMGCPYHMCIDDAGVEHDVEYGMTRWKAVLQEIIDGWELFLAEGSCTSRENQERIVHADKLFFENLHSLWW